MSAPPRVRVDPTPWVNVALPAADGTSLVCDTHLPPPDRWPVPTVVTRTPYGRSTHLAEGRSWRSRGFGYVVQDVRGRYDSEGRWVPYRNERADGAALLDWVCAQPWSDGRIVAYGGSYSGYTAWTMAVERPDAVRAVVSLGPSMGLHRTKYEPSGILRLAEHAAWWLDRADSRTSRDGLRDIVFSEQPDLLEHLPVIEIGARSGVDLPHWADALHGHPDQAPPEAVTDAELAGLTASTLHVAGWYDLLLGETLHLYNRAGFAVAVRPTRELIVGPWGHDLGMGPGTRVGEREHGPASTIRFGDRCVGWLRDALDGSSRSGHAEVFVLGENSWTTRPSWPSPGGPTRHWHPDVHGGLGRAPGSAGEIEFRHDPTDPYPSALPATDRCGLDARTDVARFVSYPLTTPLWIDGAGRAELAVSTNTASADWIVRLLERTTDGRLLEITHGSAIWAGPGRAQIDIALDPVAIRLPTGSRLVLDITAADFPFLARNLGTEEDRCLGVVTCGGTRTVHIGPTRLTLPEAARD